MNKFLLILLLTFSNTVFAASPLVDCISGLVTNLTISITTMIKHICNNKLVTPNNTFFVLDEAKVTVANATEFTLYNFYIIDQALKKVSFTFEKFKQMLYFNSVLKNKAPFILNSKQIIGPDRSWFWKINYPDIVQSNISDINYFFDGIGSYKNNTSNFNTCDDNNSEINNYKSATICLSVFIGVLSIGAATYFIKNKYLQSESNVSVIDNNTTKNNENSYEDIEASVEYTQVDNTQDVSFDALSQEKTFDFSSFDLSNMKKYFGYLYHYYSFKEYLREQYFKYLLEDENNTAEILNIKKIEYKNLMTKLNMELFFSCKNIFSALKDSAYNQDSINNKQLFNNISMEVYKLSKNKIIPLNEDKILMAWLHNHKIKDLDIEQKFDLQHITSLLEQLITFKDVSYDYIYNDHNTYKFANVFLTVIKKNYKKLSRLWFLADKVKDFYQ